MDTGNSDLTGRLWELLVAVVVGAISITVGIIAYLNSRINGMEDKMNAAIDEERDARERSVADERAARIEDRERDETRRIESNRRIFTTLDKMSQDDREHRDKLAAKFEAIADRLGAIPTRDEAGRMIAAALSTQRRQIEEHEGRR